MALVPNGRSRTQEKQALFYNGSFSFAQAAPEQQNTQQKPQVDPRLQIEQQEIGNGQPAGATPPQASPAKSPAAPQSPFPQAADDAEEQPMPGEEVPDASLKGEDGQKPNDDGSGGESEIKDTWKQMLQSIGVPPRTIDNLEKQLYSEETDLASNTLKGHYMIPTYTAQGKITKQKALQLARQMEQKYGLTSKMKLDGRNWRIDFSTRPKLELQHGGSSFDHLMSSPGQAKAASYTLGEMITARRDELFNTMRKIAKGNK